MKTDKPTKIIYNYVFIVYNWGDGVIEDVFVNRSEAEGKADKLRERDLLGAKIAVLKKVVKGKQAPHPIWDW